MKHERVDKIDLERELGYILDAATRASHELAAEVRAMLEEEPEHPQDSIAAARLLNRILERIAARARAIGDEQVANEFNEPLADLTRKILAFRNRIEQESAARPPSPPVQLVEHNGLKPRPILPMPIFHGLSVPVREGFVKTTDIRLWDQNERLEIHLNQFRSKHGRPPTSEELLDIILSKMDLPGIPSEDADDQFEIWELARSIATNGVRLPPVIDTEGTLWDGNRRVAACYLILNSDEFTIIEKERVSHVKVWQMTEDVTPNMKDHVVVALNFEDDCKKPWPTYIKARRVYEAWEAALEREPDATPKRQSAMKKEISRKFALGPDTSYVSRYIRMVTWANEFETHQTAVRRRGEFEVKHRTDKAFEYFDELSKGVSPGTVQYTLNSDEPFKHLVFDLLYEGKFKNWKQIRDLKHVAGNEDSLNMLRKARELAAEDGEEMVEDALALARARSVTQRELGVNTRIEAFVQFTRDFPTGSWTNPDRVNPENLLKLVAILRTVEQQAKDLFGDEFEARLSDVRRRL